MTEHARKRRRYRMVARAEAAAATRERILAAAWQAFSERPYEDVRLADVASAAGTTAQTLHNQLGAKDDLFVAAWHWRMDPETARRGAAPVGDLRVALRVLYDSYEEHGDAALRLLAQEHRIPAVLEMTDDGRARHRAWVERTFEPALAGLRGAARERRLIALVAALDLQVWKLLRREMGLGRKTAEQIVTEMVTALEGAS